MSKENPNELKIINKNERLKYQKLLYEYKQQIAELKAENERLKQENRDMHTAVNQTIADTLMIKEDNARLKTCIDNRIVELQQQLKDNTKQVCEKIREKAQGLWYFVLQEQKEHFEGNRYVLSQKDFNDILDQIEKGE